MLVIEPNPERAHDVRNRNTNDGAGDDHGERSGEARGHHEDAITFPVAGEEVVDRFSGEEDGEFSVLSSV